MKGAEIIGQLKRKSTWRLFFLGLITYRIYFAYYIRRQTKIINQHLDMEHQLAESLVNFIFILSYLNVILIVPYLFVEEGQPVEAIGKLTDIVLQILSLIWSFKFRNRMNLLLGATKDKPYWFHGLWTFLFQMVYFNYKINQLNENIATQRASLDEDSTELHPHQ